MMNFIAVMQLLGALIPIISQTIKAVEEAIPAPGQGPAKLQLMKGMLEGAYGQMNNATIAFESIWPMIQGMVASLVAIYNTIGVFKK